MSVPAPGEIAELRDTMTNDEIFTVLVEECGARESLRAEFLHHWPCGEFRFQGALGFGGKIHSRGGIIYDGVWEWSKKLFVSCYAEDETPERREMILRANARLPH
jgi:hypothetical protein